MYSKNQALWESESFLCFLPSELTSFALCFIPPLGLGVSKSSETPLKDAFHQRLRKITGEAWFVQWGSSSFDVGEFGEFSRARVAYTVWLVGIPQRIWHLFGVY